MRDIILNNERYGTIEIDNNGLITGYNNNGHTILSEIYNLSEADSLNGKYISDYNPAASSKPFDFVLSGDIISSIDGIKLIDTIIYKEKETAIIRFVKDNREFLPFFNIIKHASSIYLELSKDIEIIFASDSLSENLGMHKSEFYGRSIASFTDKENMEKIIHAIENLKGYTPELKIKIETIQFSFKGNIISYNMELIPVIDSSGKYAGVFANLTDNSYENKCGKMRHTIRRMSAVANFAGGIAHDYNNALTAVLGNISLAMMDAEKNSELDELLRDAESAGLKIKILTERLGMFARGMKPVKDKTDIKKLIEEMMPEVLTGYKGHYSVIAMDNMAQPEIDQELISEAIKHVIENAIEATDKPEGEILINVEETEIIKEVIFRETSLVSGRYIVISIEDNGAGVDQLVSSDIFDPYITTKTGREGLGLALTYTILKRHRGFISMETPEKGGVNFKIYIPLF